MLHKIYERRIKKVLEIFPKELCFMITEDELSLDSKKLLEVLNWVREFPEIKRFIVHVSTCNEKQNSLLSGDISVPFDEMAKIASITLSTANGVKTSGSKSPEVLVVIGKCGKQEIVDAIVKIAESKIKPDDITEETIEQHLLYKVTPDFVIKTGGNHLTDFLIWQSVYSELFFTDVNWNKFRRVDFLRALRDFQSRNRRFGK